MSGKWLQPRLPTKGREEGREQGRRGERVELLLRQLVLKFGDLSPELEARVRGASFNELGVVAKRILTAARVEELFD